eukprot:9200065-Pyramimonas_sp.AAC.1
MTAAPPGALGASGEPQEFRSSQGSVNRQGSSAKDGNLQTNGGPLDPNGGVQMEDLDGSEAVQAREWTS